jgi:ribosomal-protein-alanine N-acetyltransferase
MEPKKVTFSPRLATEQDLPAIAGIEQRVHVAPWTEENFRAEIEKPFSMFMLMTDDETDEVVAGYIVFWVMFEECQILNVAVDLPFRRIGLAKELVRKAVKLAMDKQVKRVVLDVRKSNAPAIELYQSLAFAITQVRKSYYSNGEDAYEMTCRLARQEGILVGYSSGAALQACYQLANEIQEGIIVTVFPDGGDRYLETRFWDEVIKYWEEHWKYFENT